MAGDDESGISICTESLRLRLRGGVMVFDLAPGDFRSDFGPFLVSLVNLIFGFLSVEARLSRSGLIVSNGSLKDDVIGFDLFCFSVSEDLDSDTKFV